MAKTPALKVFRTAIGFHDAYVAAKSQKAALEAWGTDRNLFARGAAEIVEDPKLTAAALASPGVVLKVLRGTPAEQIAALSGGKGQRVAAKAPQKAIPVKRKATTKPSRAKLDEAHAQLAAIQARHTDAQAELAREEAAVMKRRAAMERAQAREITTCRNAVDRRQADYDRAMEKWRAD